jgi:hypothetical protein
MPAILRVILHDEVTDLDSTITARGLEVITSGTAQTVITAAIDISTAGNNTIVAADANYKIKVVTLTFTLSLENDIKLVHGSTDFSGAMPFGGTNEPKGMTMNFWPFPLETAVNEAFIMNLSTAAQVSGLVQYFKET